MSAEPNKKENVFSLPDVEVKKTLPIRFVNKAVSLTFIIIVAIVVIGTIVVFSVSTSITIKAEGILEPSKITHIHSIESGIIKKILVKSGDTVSVNQALVILDSTALMTSLFDIQSRIASDKNSYNQKKEKAIFDKRQSELSLQSAEAQLIKAKASFRDRISGFFPKANLDSLFNNYKPGENITLDYAMSDVRSAETAINSSKLGLQMLDLTKYELTQLQIDLDKLYEQERIIKEKLKNCILRSNVPGIVLTEGIENLVNNYVTEGTKLLDIAETKEWDAVLFVNENDIHQVKLNDSVKIKLDALQSTGSYELYNASVTSIAAEKISAKDYYPNFAGLYRVSVKLYNTGKPEQSKFKYGYKVNGEIITDSGKIVDLLIKYFRNLL